MKSKQNWKLVRAEDQLTRYSEDILFLEFDTVGDFKSKYKEPAVGLSLVMSP